MRKTYALSSFLMKRSLYTSPQLTQRFFETVAHALCLGMIVGSSNCVGFASTLARPPGSQLSVRGTRLIVISKIGLAMPAWALKYLFTSFL